MEQAWSRVKAERRKWRPPKPPNKILAALLLLAFLICVLFWVTVGLVNSPLVLYLLYMLLAAMTLHLLEPRVTQYWVWKVVVILFPVLFLGPVLVTLLIDNLRIAASYLGWDLSEAHLNTLQLFLIVLSLSNGLTTALALMGA